MESTLSRRDRERLLRRQAMIEAARALFAEKGFANATIEEVAQRAEFGKGTLYNYFEGGKEDLLYAVLDEIYDGIGDVLKTMLPQQYETPAAFRAQFRAFLVRFFHYFESRQDVFVFLARESNQLLFDVDSTRACYFFEQTQKIIGALTEAIEEAQKRGIVRDVPALSAAHTIFGNLMGYQTHLCLKHRTPQICLDALPSIEQAADFITIMLLDGLLVSSDAETRPTTFSE